MPEKARVFGRVLRLILAIAIGLITVPVYLSGGSVYIATSVGVAFGLSAFYLALHLFVMRFVPNVNRWAGALLAVLPVAVVFVLGQGGGPIFGNGEGATGALTFLMISFIVDFYRSDSGCEVMAIPGLIFGDRTPLACLLLTPIDLLEKKLRER